MTAELESDAQLEIGHVLFMDIVGFSKLMVDEQSDASHWLNQIVRNTEQFRAAEAANKLTRLPTGDGMVLVFYTGPETPARCAMEIARSLKEASFGLRMGIHSGPVNKVLDVNDRSNLAGTGINMAQRVMDCGDAGHILLSKRVTEDLEQHSKWRPRLHHLGEFEVKHGVKIDIVNLFTDEVGNPALPAKLKDKRVAPSFLARFTKPLIGAALLVAIALVSVWFFVYRGEERSSGLPLATVFPGKSIAVLPFKPLVASNRDEILEAGMADSLITKLSTTREIIVPSLSSVRKYDDLKQDSVSTGRALRVNSVLEGNVQKSGDRIRVTARLIKTADGSSLWADTFDEKFTDVFAVQDAIAKKVADALALRLTEEEQQQLTKRYTENTEAYQLYLKGRFHWNKYTEDGFRKAIEFYNQAVEKDPNYALAYAGLADAYIQLGDLGFAPPRENFPKVKAYAAKALALDEKLAQAHVAMGTFLLFYEWNWVDAEKELTRGIKLNPSYPDARHFYDHYLETQGRLEEALVEIKRGLELDPLSLIINNELAWANYHARRYDVALEQIRKTLEMDPNFFLAYQILAQTYEMMGQPEAAIEALQKALEPSGNWSWLVAELGCAYAANGNIDSARQIIEQLKQRSAKEFVDPYLIATIYVHLGENDAAFVWFDKAISERSSNLLWFNVEPKFDRLRSDPRCNDLLRRMGLN